MRVRDEWMAENMTCAACVVAWASDPRGAEGPKELSGVGGLDLAGQDGEKCYHDHRPSPPQSPNPTVDQSRRPYYRLPARGYGKLGWRSRGVVGGSALRGKGRVDVATASLDGKSGVWAAEGQAGVTPRAWSERHGLLCSLALTQSPHPCPVQSNPSQANPAQSSRSLGSSILVYPVIINVDIGIWKG
ncbi:hypothetical protein E2C01_043796 [Portunus trituberculatus]|uniref:Uncharacterized protein n=1 Tax=Portunus trituberculatus TaxID=210409 RepID=A0A5B7FYN8_PORTR|nr:hypothetical protein [Portunus trituberculatus]